MVDNTQEKTLRCDPSPETEKNSAPEPDVWQKQPWYHKNRGFCRIVSKKRIHNGPDRTGLPKGNPGPYAASRQVSKTDEIRATLRRQCIGQPNFEVDLNGFLGERQPDMPLRADYIIKQAEHREETEPEINSILSRQYNPFYDK
jgi:hypothetical protein